MRSTIVVILCLLLLASCSKKRAEDQSLTASESLKTMHLSDDFHVELFVSEPDVMSPVEMAFDENGNIYVAEMMDYPDDPPAGKPARSRIRLLQDTNGDGKVDRTTIFADQVLAVSGFMPWKGGLIVTSAPDILFLKDENGDGKADVRKVLYTGFPKVNHEARITNPRLASDNWIYCSNAGSNGRITSPDHPEMAPVLVRGTDFRFDPVSGKAEAASGPAQFGSTIDDFGNRFISQNTTHIRHVVMPMQYLAHAPLLEVREVAQDISDHGRPSAPMYPLTGPQEWRKQRTQLRQQRYNENNLNRTEQLSGWFTAASGGTLYDGDAFPAEYVGNVFTGDVSGNLIHRDILRRDGATFLAARAKPEVEFLASTDVWFRPCHFANAPDGNLYVTDIYRNVIETPESIPEEIRRNIDFYKGDTMGRIYRIVPNKPRRTGNLKPDMGRLSTVELVRHLGDANGWHRSTAHRLILERQDRAAIPALKTLAESGASPEARVRALWLLDSLGALDPSQVERALHDGDGRIREQALRLSEARLGKSAALANTALAMTSDPEPRVQFQAALTLGAVKANRKLNALATLAHQRSADPWFRIAILSATADEASPFFHALVAKGEDWTDSQLLADLSALVGARQNPAEISQWLGRVVTMKSLDKLLEGLTRGLRLSNVRNLKVSGAEQALNRFLSSNNEPVQRAAWEAARHLELAGLVGQAGNDAVAANLPVARRVVAVRALRGGGFQQVAPVIEKVLASHPPPEVEAAAVDSLAAFDEPAAGDRILSYWRSYSPVARQHAVAAMLAQKNRVPLLLAAVEKGQVERSALDAAARSHLYESADTAIAQKARQLLESTNTDRQKVITEYRDALTLAGDVARGKKVFEDNCAKCHMPRRQGGRVGPDLSGINNKTKEELLTSILNPSYAIEPRFVNYVVTTTDGRMFDGVIANETPGAITLRGGSEEGDETILRKNIAEIRASSVSLMPEDLEKSVSKQNVADVIAYLRGGL